MAGLAVALEWAREQITSRVPKADQVGRIDSDTLKRLKELSEPRGGRNH
ncbi:MAG: hypothetical protein WBV80_27695 [Mycobacterium sp.]